MSFEISFYDDNVNHELIDIEAYNIAERRVKLNSKTSLFLLIILDKLTIRSDLVRFVYILYFLKVV